MESCGEVGVVSLRETPSNTFSFVMVAELTQTVIRQALQNQAIGTL
jgi:hypothetical protein